MRPSPPLAALLVFAAVATARAQHAPGPTPNVGPPLLLRLDGVIEPSADAAREKGFAVVSLAFLRSDERRWLGITDARTVGGDHPLLGKDVLEIVAPFDPNFIVVGPEDMVARVRDAPPDTSLRLEGLVDRGSRTYYLRSVEQLGS